VNTAGNGSGYLIRIGGCNDCHTPGYLQADGKIRMYETLTGPRHEGPRAASLNRLGHFIDHLRQNAR
jgi:hypothetical protein